MNKCLKKDCNNPQTIGKNLCKKHTEMWQTIWKKSRNKDWYKFITNEYRSVEREKVCFT